MADDVGNHRAAVRWLVASDRARARVSARPHLPIMARRNLKIGWFHALVRAMRTGLCIEGAWLPDEPPRRGWPGRPYELRSVCDQIISEYRGFGSEKERLILRRGAGGSPWCCGSAGRSISFNSANFGAASNDYSVSNDGSSMRGVTGLRGVRFWLRAGDNIHGVSFMHGAWPSLPAFAAR